MAVLTPEQQALVARGFPSVALATRKWARRCRLPQERIEDACMDALIAAARSWRPGMLGFGAWLYTTMDFRVRKTLQREQLRLRTRIEFDLDASPENEPGSFLACTEHGYLQVEVRDLLQHLPPSVREAIALYYLEGLTTSEAAARMRLPTSTFTRRIQEGRRRLHDLLQ